MANTLNLVVANAVFFIGLGISSNAIDPLSWQRQVAAAGAEDAGVTDD